MNTQPISSLMSARTWTIGLDDPVPVCDHAFRAPLESPSIAELAGSKLL